MKTVSGEMLRFFHLPDTLLIRSPITFQFQPQAKLPNPGIYCRQHKSTLRRRNDATSLQSNGGGLSAICRQCLCSNRRAAQYEERRMAALHSRLEGHAILAPRSDQRNEFQQAGSRLAF